MSDTPKMSKPYPAQAWRMPPLSTVWVCDDSVQRTLGEMIAGMEDGFVPKNDEDVLMVLERFGCDWTSPIVTYSFMQRDKAMDALTDSDRYQKTANQHLGCSDLRWVHDALVNATIGEFVQTHLPDAHDWENASYRITSLDGEDGQAFRVETEIPTSEVDCWISFEIAIPTYETEPMVLFFQAIRSGKGADAETTYVCRGIDGAWVISDEEGDTPSER